MKATILALGHLPLEISMIVLNFFLHKPLSFGVSTLEQFNYCNYLTAVITYPPFLYLGPPPKEVI